MKADNNNKKRKALADDEEEDGSKGAQNDENIDIAAFVEKELGKTKLGQPLRRPTRTSSIEIEQLDKALKRLNKLLLARRGAKLHTAASQAVEQQIDYLRLTTAQKDVEVQRDDQGCIRVDQDFWIDDLPEAWPTGPKVSSNESQADRDQYAKLLASVRRLEQQRADLLLNTTIREEAINYLRSCPDDPASRKDACNWLTEAIDGALKP